MKIPKNMPKKYLLPLVAGALLTVACNKNDEPIKPNPPQEIEDPSVKNIVWSDKNFLIVAHSDIIRGYAADPTIKHINMILDPNENDFTTVNTEGFGNVLWHLNYRKELAPEKMAFHGEFIILPNVIDPADSLGLVKLGHTFKLATKKQNTK